MCICNRMLTMVMVCAAMFSGLSAQSGVRVFTEPGVEVFLDEKYMGTSQLEKGGLDLPDVPAGEYRISMYKHGNYPQKRSVVVKDSEVCYIYTQPFTDGSESAYLISLTGFMPWGADVEPQEQHAQRNFKNEEIKSTYSKQSALSPEMARVHD